MYGTVARMRVKPGRTLAATFERQEMAGIPGAVASFAYRMDSDPDTYMLCVVFESKEAYRANADSPAQNERYREMMDVLAEEPMWADGEVVEAWMAEGATI